LQKKFASAAVITSLTVFAAICTSAAPPPVVDPDWPCQQRLVPSLAAATYWSATLPDNLSDWRADSKVASLVQHLAPRRVTTEEGLAHIAAFTRALSDDRSRRLALAFRGLLEETNRERAALIEELKQIGKRQRELADLAARLTTALNAIAVDASGEAGARRIDLQQRRDFTVRNFDEIQHTIRYACETPIQLDARLGAWARALQNAEAK